MRARTMGRTSLHVNSPARMHPLANALFAGPWTAAVTVVGVGAARVTGQYDYIPRAERFWARGLARAWDVSVDVEGAERVDPDATYVVMANHQSHLDVPILFMTLPIVPGFLAKKELGRVPFLSMALHAGGHILIDRKNHQSAMKVLDDAAAEVESGKTLAVFPEGARGDGRVLGELKKGGFIIAKKAGVPILPVGVRGTSQVLARKSLMPRGGPVSVRIGNPIGADDVETTPLLDLSDRVRSALSELSGLPLG